MMCVSRFAHYLKVMARDTVGTFMEQKDCEEWLNKWIGNYVLGNPENGRRRDEGQVPAAGGPGSRSRQGQAGLVPGGGPPAAALPARRPGRLDAAGGRNPPEEGVTVVSVQSKTKPGPNGLGFCLPGNSSCNTALSRAHSTNKNARLTHPRSRPGVRTVNGYGFFVAWL